MPERLSGLHEPVGRLQPDPVGLVDDEHVQAVALGVDEVVGVPEQLLTRRTRRPTTCRSVLVNDLLPVACETL